MKKRVIASLTSLALVAIVGASSVTAAVPTPVETVLGNYQCPEDTKIEPVASGTYPLADGGSITITVHNTAAGPTFDFVTSGATIEALIVKGGPKYNVYIWAPGVESAEGLHSPLNLNNGKWYGLSHLCIESTKKDEDPKK